MSLSLHICSTNSRLTLHNKAIRLALLYLNQTVTVTTTTEASVSPVLISTDNLSSKTLRGPMTIIHYLANTFDKQLLGGAHPTGFTSASIHEWFEADAQDLAKRIDDLNAFLLLRTFAVGTELTFADFYLYTILVMCHQQWNSKLKYASIIRYVRMMKALPQWSNEHQKIHDEIIGETFDLNVSIPHFEYKPIPQLQESPKSAPKSTDKKSTDKKSDSKPAQSKGKPEQGKSKKDEKKEKKKKAKKEQPKATGPSPNLVDIRVGRIVEIKRHENADGLYVEQVDLGEEAPRQICSGLVGKIDMDRLNGALVLVMTNLKPASLKGAVSNGMVLVTNKDGKFDMVQIPQDTPVGERVLFEGSNQDEKPEAEVNKKKLAKYVPNLMTNDKGEVTFSKQYVMKTSKGTVKGPFADAVVG